jgi:membrane glycosyltransferase
MVAKSMARAADALDGGAPEGGVVSLARHAGPARRTNARQTEAAQRHGAQSLLGIAWIAVVYWLNPGHVWWLLPVAGAMALAIPLSVILSRASLGRRFRRAGLFLIPEEANGSVEMRRTAALTRLARVRADFVRVIVDPEENARARAVALRGHNGVAARRACEALLHHALAQEPSASSGR